MVCNLQHPPKNKIYFSGEDSDKEAVLRKRRNITNKQINDTYNLPTADKLIKPTGAHEHAGSKYKLSFEST